MSLKYLDKYVLIIKDFPYNTMPDQCIFVIRGLNAAKDKAIELLQLGGYICHCFQFAYCSDQGTLVEEGSLDGRLRFSQ